MGNGCPIQREALSLHSGVTVRKKLQWLGNSRVLLLDRRVLAEFLPDGDFDQELLVEVKRGELRVLPTAQRQAPSPAHATVTLPAFDTLKSREQAILRELATRVGSTGEVAERIGGASVPTFSLALNRLLRAGWLRKVGRDWHLTDVGRAAVTPQH